MNNKSARTVLLFASAITLTIYVQQVPLPALQNGPGGQGGGQGKGKAGEEGIATIVELPSLGGPTQPFAVNAAGTVIVGESSDPQDILHPVKWTLQNGNWTITALPFPSDATSAEARDINNNGDIAGYDHPSSMSRPLLWHSTGGFTILGCGEAGPNNPSAISASAQVVVGARGITSMRPVLWRPGGCREELPLLVEDQNAAARAVNSDGTLVSGVARTPSGDSSIAVPVRWRNLGGQWTIEQLDTLPGSVLGGNADGDAAGSVQVPCGTENVCSRATIWYAAGGSLQLGTLGGDSSTAHDVNATGEVVGSSTLPRGGTTGFYWSEATGMVQLPAFRGRGGALAFSVSDLKADGTRLAVGTAAGGPHILPVVWVIRNP